MTKFNETLLKIMNKQGLSAYKMAGMLDIKLSTFYDMLRSENIMLRNALRVVDYFGSSLDYFEKKTKTFYCDYKKDYKINIYESVKKYMAEKNVTFQRMCADLGMSRTNLTRWRDGDAPKYQTVVQMANYLNMSIDEFIGRV
ncbi:MAG: helix-turn-helix transcriptional regulator [Clostridia bacterium]|nr:helix-turn-helix transcriptional regulator [Clostridia bacterium]